MVLVRVLALVALLAGCRQSLFEAGGGGTQPDAALASTCPSPCVADLGGDFGKGQSAWRYLEDHRNRAWTAMTAAGDHAVGADPANTLTSCALHDAAACSMLPGAMLASSSGSAASADPAAELTFATNQVVQLDLGAYVATGASQTIRLYRNSREDVLFTTIADAGAVVTHSLTIDALAGDRLLVAVAPTGAGATDVGIQLFVSAAPASFPSTCQLALEFASDTGTTIHNSCGVELSSVDDATGAPTAGMVTGGPFAEQGRAGLLAANDYYQSAGNLDRMSDTTTQLWIKQTANVAGNPAWFISDLDLDNGGGLGIDVAQPAMGGSLIEALTCVTATPLDIEGVSGSYPEDHAWHFVRVVSSGGQLALCLDGQKVQSKPFGPLKTTYPPYIGKNVIWTPAGAFVDGAVDDVRVITGALPCD